MSFGMPSSFDWAPEKSPVSADMAALRSPLTAELEARLMPPLICDWTFIMPYVALFVRDCRAPRTGDVAAFLAPAMRPEKDAIGCTVNGEVLAELGTLEES